MVQVEWAHGNVDSEHLRILEEFRATQGYQEHWSRRFEYPWVIRNGGFKSGMRVLDAGGGHGPLQYYLDDRLECQVVNMDEDLPAPRYKGNIRLLKGRLEDIPEWTHPFDHVVCASVLEHVLYPDDVLRKLWQVTKPGGRLIVTMDVAGYARWNHSIDERMAKNLLLWTIGNSSLPPEPENILSARFEEIERSKWEPDSVWLRVLCFYVDKPMG